MDGAAVRVSMVCFSALQARRAVLNGSIAAEIRADLSELIDLSSASKISDNEKRSFVGIQKTGSFNIPGEIAREQLRKGGNPNSKPNSDVIFPYLNGMDLTRRWRDIWIIYFPLDTNENDAALYEAPFEYLRENVRPVRAGNKIEWLRNNWWITWRPRPEMRAAIDRLMRFIVTPEVSKHRVFAWMQRPALPDKNLMIIARDDDATFGILHSRFHEIWSLRMCTWLGMGNDPRYTPSTTFETFPFPEGLTPNIPAADYADDPRAQKIAAAAARLNELRENWLNPPDLIRREPEVVPGYPDRILPRDDAAAKELKKRTLTNLYNARPSWLDLAHTALDEAVAEAYGWGEDWRAGLLTDDEIVARLFALNQERAAAGR